MITIYERVTRMARDLTATQVYVGSTPITLSNWDHSSVARTPARHAGGRWFKSIWSHHLLEKNVLQDNKQSTKNTKASR